MTDKQVLKQSSVKEKILLAVDSLNDPIRQTLSPKGSNVIYTDGVDATNVTNDGATIAKNISFSDPVMDAVASIIKTGSFRTNTEAGDGTSSTILLSSLLIKEGIKLVEDGWNRMEIKREYDAFADTMVKGLESLKRPIKNDKDLYFIAKVSASGEEKIAETVVKTVKVAGEDGMVFIEPSNSMETEIVEDTGFNIGAGMFAPELRNNPKSFSASYLNVPVLITDKRLYYAQEAETILSTALKNGYKEVVIVAKDFIGEALPFFITNHTKGSIRVLLVKDPKKDDPNTLDDLAVYLGGEVVSDKKGSIVDNLSIEDFVIAKKVFADGQKTILSRDKDEVNPALNSRIDALKKELKKYGNEENNKSKDLKERLASLTTGIVTIRVGGATPLEVNEKIFRYEDAVNATRTAMKDGYLVGGGISLLRAFQNAKFKGDLAKVFKKVSEASVRQIAENCGLNPDTAIDTVNELGAKKPNVGFNALSGVYEDLLEAGVIDPYKVTEMAIRNAVSVAGLIVGSGFMVVKEEEKNESK